MRTILYVLGCTITLAARGQELNAQPGRLELIARSPFVDQIPFAEARAASAEGTTRLLAMLGDERESAHWANVVTLLGIVGDTGTFRVLRDVVLTSTRSRVSPDEYRAKSAALLAMGYLVNRVGQEVAFDFLMRASDPAFWGQAGLNWQSPFHSDRAALEETLSEVATLALALTGRPAAEALLAKINAGEGPPRRRSAAARETAAQALRHAVRVRTEGLAAYYRPRERRR